MKKNNNKPDWSAICKASRARKAAAGLCIWCGTGQVKLSGGGLCLHCFEKNKAQNHQRQRIKQGIPLELPKLKPWDFKKGKVVA